MKDSKWKLALMVILSYNSSIEFFLRKIHWCFFGEDELTKREENMISKNR